MVKPSQHNEKYSFSLYWYSDFLVGALDKILQKDLDTNNYLFSNMDSREIKKKSVSQYINT